MHTMLVQYYLVDRFVDYLSLSTVRNSEYALAIIVYVKALRKFAFRVEKRTVMDILPIACCPAQRDLWDHTEILLLHVCFL